MKLAMSYGLTTEQREKMYLKSQKSHHSLWYMKLLMP